MNKGVGKTTNRSAKARFPKANRVDHDEIFKALLTLFFVEFVAAFLPGVAPYLDPASIEFVDKELLRGVSGRRKRSVDLVVKARFRGQLTYFLIHVENQSKAETGFARRMFRYFARLLEKFDLPVYPVAILSYDAPNRPEPDRYEVVFPDKNVLQFQYTTIQLNRLSWKDYIKTPNPAAAALMTKMAIAPEDQTKVAGEITRMMLTLKLDADKADLIFSFMESYLKLTGEELKQYERELEETSPEEDGMIKSAPWSSWGRAHYARAMEAVRQEFAEVFRAEAIEAFRVEGEEKGRAEGEEKGRAEGEEKGRAEGEEKGKETLIERLIKKRFGSVSAQTTERITQLSADQLDDLGEALLDFASAADLETWLAAPAQN